MEQERQSSKSAKLIQGRQLRKARASDTQLSSTIIAMISDDSAPEELSKKKQKRRGSGSSANSNSTTELTEATDSESNTESDFDSDF
jgi:hypothetical protein